MNRRFTSIDYRKKILTPFARNSLMKCTGLQLDQAIFQKDNASIHTAKVRHCLNLPFRSLNLI